MERAKEPTPIFPSNKSFLMDANETKEIVSYIFYEISSHDVYISVSLHQF
jgi:hypothetical protein